MNTMNRLIPLAIGLTLNCLPAIALDYIDAKDVDKGNPVWRSLAVEPRRFEIVDVADLQKLFEAVKDLDLRLRRTEMQPRIYNPGIPTLPTPIRTGHDLSNYVLMPDNPINCSGTNNIAVGYTAASKIKRGTDFYYVGLFPDVYIGDLCFKDMGNIDYLNDHPMASGVTQLIVSDGHSWHCLVHISDKKDKPCCNNTCIGIRKYRE